MDVCLGVGLGLGVRVEVGVVVGECRFTWVGVCERG